MTLVYLKALAVVVKESQTCSSSEDEASSDCSVSSRGSGSLAEEEQEASLITGNVIRVLRQLTTFTNGASGRHHSSNLTSTVTHLFSDQDDALVEALLCLLDISVNCHQSIAAETSLADLIDPIQGFEGLVASVSNDHTVLLDFLVSNETCFLLYFLRFLKFLNKRSVKLDSGVAEILQKMKTAVGKLTNKQLFPYDIGPVQRLLDKVA